MVSGEGRGQERDESGARDVVQEEGEAFNAGDIEWASDDFKQLPYE